MVVYGGEKHPVTFSKVKKVERNIVFTLLFTKNNKIKDAKSFENTNIKQLTIYEK